MEFAKQQHSISITPSTLINRNTIVRKSFLLYQYGFLDFYFILRVIMYYCNYFYLKISTDLATGRPFKLNPVFFDTFPSFLVALFWKES